jgi:ABC-2 type transport system ATP-binding protein
MTPQTPALRLHGLVKSYGDFRLGPLDLELEPGRVLAFVGPNGAGKSTTLQAILHLLRRDAGTVEIFGKPNDPEATDWKQEVGYVGEVQGFYKGWTVEQNLRFVGRFYPGWTFERVRDLARRFDLRLDREVRALSRGNRTKLALVAALGHDPRLLLLDEPTSGLDPVVRAEVLDVLWELLEDGERSILYSTHVLSDISRLADELAFLRNGQLVERSEKDELMESWRRIAFVYDGDAAGLAGVRRSERQGKEHRVLSSNHEATLKALGSLGARNVQPARLTIDEIAIEILKEGHHVVAA